MDTIVIAAAAQFKMGSPDAYGLIGAGVGSLVGNVAVFFANPDMFTVSYLRIVALVILAASAAGVVIALSSGASLRLARLLVRRQPRLPPPDL